MQRTNVHHSSHATVEKQLDLEERLPEKRFCRFCSRDFLSFPIMLSFANLASRGESLLFPSHFLSFYLQWRFMLKKIKRLYYVSYCFFCLQKKVMIQKESDHESGGSVLVTWLFLDKHFYRTWLALALAFNTLPF